MTVMCICSRRIAAAANGGANLDSSSDRSAAPSVSDYTIPRQRSIGAEVLIDVGES